MTGLWNLLTVLPALSDHLDFPPIGGLLTRQTLGADEEKGRINAA